MIIILNLELVNIFYDQVKERGAYRRDLQSQDCYL
jgi:hypothetical protein